LNYQWQYITPRPYGPYLHCLLNHTRIQHRTYFRIHIRLRRLVPSQFSMQIARYLLFTHILRLLRLHPYPLNVSILRLTLALNARWRQGFFVPDLQSWEQQANRRRRLGRRPALQRPAWHHRAKRRKRHLRDSRAQKGVVQSFEVETRRCPSRWNVRAQAFESCTWGNSYTRGDLQDRS